MYANITYKHTTKKATANTSASQHASRRLLHDCGTAKADFPHTTGGQLLVVFAQNAHVHIYDRKATGCRPCWEELCRHDYTNRIGFLSKVGML